jgi:hypothetical protein
MSRPAKTAVEARTEPEHLVQTEDGNEERLAEVAHADVRGNDSLPRRLQWGE